MYEKAKELIKAFEGFRSEAYHCPAGYPTIGYGEKISNVKWSDLSEYDSITEEEADQLLEDRCDEIAEFLDSVVQVELEEHQRDALISFTYNVGSGNFKSSTLLKVLNEERFDAVPEQLKRWKYSGKIVLLGLVRRREAEAALFIG